MAGEWAGIACVPAWAPDGDWQFAYDWSVRDARVITVGMAKRDAAWDIGFTNARVWKRHLRGLLLWEQWEHHCEDEGWYEDDPDGPDGAEREMARYPPAGWEPHEDIPVWMFCHATDPGAVPCLVVGEKGDAPPPRPDAMNETWRRNALAAMAESEESETR